MLALTAAAAYASDRFASPTGMGTACTQAQPCGIVTAINGAVANDQITIEPGTYSVSTVLSDAGNFLTIHGEAGAARPVIKTSATWGIALTGGSELGNVEIIDSANDAFGVYVNGGTPAIIRAVYVHTTGSGSWACYPDGELLDSVCWQSGPGGGAARPLLVYSANVVLINDTMIASGTGGDALEVAGAGATSMTFSLTNVIARGANLDFYVTGFVPSGGQVSITATNSNYAKAMDDTTGSGASSFTPAGSGTNQTAMPKFADAATGNFQELTGSPTIGKGATNVVAGETDLDGLPWASPPDIGAYQFYNGPSCKPVSASTKFGTAVSLHLQCSDALGDPMTLAIKSGPAYGKLSSIGSGGSVTYTPNTGYSGPDSFTYTGTSKLGTSAPATVSITVASKSGGKKPGGKKVAPVISHAKQSKGLFTFTLNEAATVTLTFARREHKRVTVKIKGRAGKNSYKAKRLKAGSYVVTLAASNAGGRSKSVKVKYKLAARR